MAVIFDRHWYINSGAITDISVHEPDIHVLSKVCRVSLTSVGILSTLCSVPSLSSSCQTNDELNGELYHYEIQTNMIFLLSYQYKKNGCCYSRFRFCCLSCKFWNVLDNGIICPSRDVCSVYFLSGQYYKKFRLRSALKLWNCELFRKWTSMLMVICFYGNVH